MKLEKDTIFFVICLCLPFIFIPAFLRIRLLGGPIGTELIVWPILLMFGYTFYIVKKGNQKFYHHTYFICFIVIYIVYSLLDLLHGFTIYPFWNLILQGPIDQIEKLPKVLSFLQSHSIGVTQKSLTEIWLALRLVKSNILDCFYFFFFSYVVYCWYKGNPSRGIFILKKSITIIIWIISFYSAFEILSFFGIDLGKQFLVTVNPFLHSIKANFGWWPPLLWPGRVRSIFPEPSYFGMYAAFCVPFLYSSYLNHESVKINLVQIFLIDFLIFLSLSKTSSVLLLFETSLFFLYILFKRNRSNIVKFLVIFFVILVSFLSSLLCMHYYISNSPEKVQSQEEVQSNNVSVRSYVEDNVAGAMNQSVGSNKARFAVINSELKTFKENPLLGVGKGLGVAYNSYNLREVQHEIPELKNCIALQEKEGILKTGFPTPSEYSKRLSEEGVLGTFVYFFPILVLFILIVKKRHKLFKSTNIVNDEAATYISLCACLISGGSGLLTVFQCYWLLLGLSYAYILHNDSDDKPV